MRASLPSNASQVFAQRGVIQLVQGKFTFIPGKGSISLPIAFTRSNRTELVTQPIWRSQIGISYDFDSLFGESPFISSDSQTFRLTIKTSHPFAQIRRSAFAFPLQSCGGPYIRGN